MENFSICYVERRCNFDGVRHDFFRRVRGHGYWRNHSVSHNYADPCTTYPHMYGAMPPRSQSSYIAWKKHFLLEVEYSYLVLEYRTQIQADGLSEPFFNCPVSCYLKRSDPPGDMGGASRSDDIATLARSTENIGFRNNHVCFFHWRSRTRLR
jgi:hypothetical protein